MNPPEVGKDGPGARRGAGPPVAVPAHHAGRRPGRGLAARTERVPGIQLPPWCREEADWFLTRPLTGFATGSHPSLRGPKRGNPAQK